MLLLLPGIITFYFNRGEKRLVVARRRVWEREQSGRYDEYPLRDVVAAQVDESRSTEDGSTWRVIVRLANGRTIPFTSYYTSGYDAKSAIANRISGFLGVTQGTQSIKGAPSPHTIARPSRRTTIAVALLVAGMGGLFGSIGGVTVVREYRRLAAWRPVHATVLASRVDDDHSDSDGNSYLPVVVYRYSVDDIVYTSSRTLPVNESRSGRWAHDVIARFRVGGTYTAWYNPANPEEAFIVRSHSVVAPVFVVLGLFAVIGGGAIAMSARRQS
jgi:Protein of unknown function (DUF3592)